MLMRNEATMRNAALAGKINAVSVSGMKIHYFVLLKRVEICDLLSEEKSR